MNVDACHTGNFMDPLVHLHIGGHATGEHHRIDARLSDKMRHLAGHGFLQHPLISGGHIDLGKPCGQIACQVEIGAAADAERATVPLQLCPQHIAQDLGVTVGSQADNLPCMAVGHIPQPPSHRLVHGAQ